MQFLYIEPDSLSIITEEIDDEMPLKTLHKNLKTEFTDLKPRSTNEQILIYDTNCLKDWLLFAWLSFLWAVWIRWKVISVQAKFWFLEHLYNTPQDVRHAFFRNTAHPSQIVVCVVPYVYLCSYDIYIGDKENNPGHWNRDDDAFSRSMLAFLQKLLTKRNDDEAAQENQQENSLYSSFFTGLVKRMEKLLLSKKPVYKKESALMHLALNQHENDLFSQKDTVLETLLYFKWKKKLKYRFYLVCLVHAVYYVSFSVGVLFAHEVFGYTIGTTLASNPEHLLAIVLMLASCGVLWFQEVRQFFKMRATCWKYVLSFYNCLDLVALALPTINLWQMLTDRPGLASVLI